MGAPGTAVPRNHRRGANAIAPEIDRLGEQRARLLADNIELDQKAALLAEQIAALEARVNQMAAAGCRHARGPARRRRGAEDAARRRCRSATRRRSQIEVELVRKQAELKFLDETSRKELNCAVEELAPADDPVPDADAIAEAEQSAATKCATASKRWGR